MPTSRLHRATPRICPPLLGLLALLLALATVLPVPALAAAGALDMSFMPKIPLSGPDFFVSAQALQTDGKVLLGGLFSNVNGISRPYIARLNTDGSLDTSFNATGVITQAVYALALQPDGKLLVGGQTTLRRLNADGSLDASFNAGDVSSVIVQHLVLQPDGKLLVGGNFSTIHGAPRKNIVRLNDDGSLDTSFDPGSGANSTVEDLVLQPDGKVLIGGQFTMVNDTARGRIARLNANGSLDASFNPSSGANWFVYALALQPDGKVLIGGQFSSVNGTARSSIARLNADGSLDSDFAPGGTQSNGSVSALALQSDGKVLIGGLFTSMNGAPRSSLARLNADGSLDTGFTAGISANNIVNSLLVQGDNKVLLAGVFSDVNGIRRRFAARINGDGSLDLDFMFASGASFAVHALALQGDGKLLVGGEFTSMNDIVRNRIARLNADGSLDTGFDPGSGANASVRVLALQGDGKLLLGGTFTSVNGSARTGIARLNGDGSLDAAFNASVSAGGNVTGLAVQPDGKILLSGNFTSVNGTARTNIARLNADGGLDTGFNPSVSAGGVVPALVLQPDGKILLGGTFTSVNGTARTNIARLNADGSLDTSFDPASGANNFVYELALQPDGKVLVGGAFSSVGGSTRRGIARLNANGSLDTSFNPVLNTGSSVWSFAVQPDASVIIGGAFTSVNSIARNNIARLNADGSLDTSFDPASGANDSVLALALQGDGKALIGGTFTSANGTPRYRLARLGSSEQLAPEIVLAGNGNSIANGDTTPSAADKTDFGGLAPGQSLTHSFTISSTGAAALNLNGTPLVNISGAAASDFVVTQQPAAMVAAGGSTSFAITFTPSGAGLRSATVSIASNDADESPYEFALHGLGLSDEPAISSSPPAGATYGAAYSHSFSVSGIPSPSFSLSGTLALGLSFDSAAGTLSGMPTRAGIYPDITITASSGDQVASQSFTITVARAALTVQADNKSRDFGQTNPPLTYSASGFVNGDDASDLDTPVTLSTSATSSSPHGSYQIVADGATDANYTISFVAGTLTVRPATPTPIYLPLVQR
jgi:uncharacterized delta-60 repeat protein